MAKKEKSKIIYKIEFLFLLSGLFNNRVFSLYSISSANENENAEICASLCSRQAVGGVCVCVLEAGGSVNHPRAPACCPWTAGTQLMTAGLVRINIHHDYLLHLSFVALCMILDVQHWEDHSSFWLFLTPS